MEGIASSRASPFLIYHDAVRHGTEIGKLAADDDSAEVLMRFAASPADDNRRRHSLRPLESRLLARVLNCGRAAAPGASYGPFRRSIPRSSSESKRTITLID